jgi:hypothetical protein
MADFFLLHRQTHVLFHQSSSGPLAVVEAGAPATQSKANMNNFIDPIERALTPAQLQQLCLLLLLARRRRACWRLSGRRACRRRRRAARAGGSGVPRMHGERYPLPDGKNEGSTLLIMC